MSLYLTDIDNYGSKEHINKLIKYTKDKLIRIVKMQENMNIHKSKWVIKNLKNTTGIEHRRLRIILDKSYKQLKFKFEETLDILDESMIDITDKICTGKPYYGYMTIVIDSINRLNVYLAKVENKISK